MRDDGNHIVIDPDDPNPLPAPTPTPPEPGPQPMPDVNVIDPEKVKKIITILNKLMTSLKSVIPGELDDTIVDGIISIDTEDWFIDVVVMLLELRKKDPEKAKLKLQAMLASLQAA